MIKATICDIVDEMEENLNVAYDKSKLFGSPCFPKTTDTKGFENLFFLGQINLSELVSFSIPLPKKGQLYFFLKIEEDRPIAGKVLYYEEEAIKVGDGWNEGFPNLISEPENAFYLRFAKGEGSIGLLRPMEEGEIEGYEAKGEIALLKIDFMEESASLPCLSHPDEVYYFLIKEEDLKTGRFEKAHLVISDS